jgi:hypothetical protein
VAELDAEPPSLLMMPLAPFRDSLPPLLGPSVNKIKNFFKFVELNF